MSTISNTIAIPGDDPRRNLVVANSDNSNAQHLGVVGDTYTILLSGMDTAGRFTLIDMHVPPGGGPPPHRHDFEETFILLDGELQATFRGEKRIIRAGETVHIPANAPHQFHNASSKAVRIALHLLAGRPRGVLQRVGNRGCDAYHCASQGRCSAGVSVHQKSN
jgi:quercetin dioxygenase-like cupin family protein